MFLTRFSNQSKGYNSASHRSAWKPTNMIVLIALMIASLPSPASRLRPPPEWTGAASPNGTFVVRIQTGDAHGEKFRSNKKSLKRFASATYFRWKPDSGFQEFQKVDLVNPVAPSMAFISNGGWLVTLGDWGNLGGRIFATYRPDGARIMSYSLQDLYRDKSRKELNFPLWLCPRSQPHLDKETLTVADVFGGRFVFWIESGQFEYSTNKDYCPTFDAYKRK